jgi:hypothetical protein
MTDRKLERAERYARRMRQPDLVRKAGPMKAGVDYDRHDEQDEIDEGLAEWAAGVCADTWRDGHD